jgi:HNH endonuclease
MTWEVPTRDVRLAREQAIKLSKNGQLFCVWSGKRLSGELIDLDHCLPWSAWPCGDLWNLMPTHRSVNQREKRSRLPADRLLRASEDRIINWWHAAYIQDQPSLREQFWLEASSSLPCIRAENDSLHDVFDAVSLQRVKLKHDQQVPEWMGEKYVGIAERPQVQEDIARDCEM